MRRETLRLVLFGLPGVGKSSLLAALAQAAQVQEPLLHGRLTDVSGELEELRRWLYEGQARPTLEESAALAITYEPLGQGGKPGRPVPVVLFDCAGRLAGGWRLAAGGLADFPSAIRQADTLILVVDAAVEAGQLGQELARCGDFLHEFEKQRGQGSEVSGLPVYLVLSKCDLLAKATDTHSAWMQRIEEHKRKVDQRFREYLAKRPEQASGAFGRLALQVWGTAVRRPVLADKPARAGEPYGVAELFRLCFAAAAAFRRQYRQAARRLHLTVAAVVGLMGLMVSLAVSFYLAQPHDPLKDLEEDVRVTLSGPGAAQDWFKDQPLQQLRKIRQDPDFARLPPAMQVEVNDLLRKMEVYQAQEREYAAQEKQLTAATRLEELTLLEKNILGKPLPAAEAALWKETRLDRRRQQLLDDVVVLRLAVNEEVAWLGEQIAQGEKLGEEWSRLIARDPKDPAWQKWAAQARAYLGRQPRHQLTDLPQGAKLATYATVYQFEGVAHKRNTWQHIKGRLEKLVQ